KMLIKPGVMISDNSIGFYRFTGKDGYLEEKSITLNGEPFMENSAIEKNGTYRFRVTARDSAGNRSQKNIDFRVIRSELELTITSPSEPVSWQNKPHAAFAGSLNTDYAVALFAAAGAGFDTLRLSNREFHTVILLDTGLNSIKVTARSLFPKSPFVEKERLIIYDSMPPKVQITWPGQNDSIISAGFRTVNVTGTCSDNHGVLWVRVNGTIAQLLPQGKFSASVTLDKDSAQYPIRALCRDSAGNISETVITVRFGSPPVLMVESPRDYEGTRDDFINIKGQIADNNPVEFFINGLQDTIRKKESSGQFTYYVDSRIPVYPPEGVKTHFLKLVDATGFEFHDTLHIVLDRTPPVCVLKIPASDYETADSLIMVTGTISENSAVVIVGRDSAVVTGNEFSIQGYRLKSGVNIISAAAYDTVGNAAQTKSAVVTRTGKKQVVYVDNTYSGTSDGSMGHPFKTITMGLSGVTDRGQVVVLKGSYKEMLVVDGGRELLGSARIKISPLSDVTQPQITLGDSSSVMNFDLQGLGFNDGISINGNGAVIDNIWIENYETGIKAGSGSGLVIKNSIVSHNTGAGISVDNHKGLNILYCRLRENAQAQIILLNCRSLIQNCIVAGPDDFGISLENDSSILNYLTLDSNGLGIQIIGGAPIVKNSIIANFESFAVKFDPYSDGTPSIHHLNLFYKDMDPDSEYVGTLSDSLKDSVYDIIYSDPRFGSNHVLGLISPAATADESGGELGYYGSSGNNAKISAKSLVPSIASPKEGEIINGNIRIIMSGSILHGYRRKSAEYLNGTDSVWTDIPLINDREHPEYAAEWNTSGLQGGTMLRVVLDGREMIRHLFIGRPEFAGSIELASPIFVQAGKDGFIYAANKTTAFKINQMGRTVKEYDSGKDTAFKKLSGALPGYTTAFSAGMGLTAMASQDSVALYRGNILISKLGISGINGMCFDSSGGLYVISAKYNSLDKIDSYGNRLYTFGGFGSGDYKFDKPSYISWNRGLLYICDSGNNRIQKYKTILSSSFADSLSVPSDSAGIPLRITQPFFVPSPYASKLGNGIVRYDLSKNADVEVSIFTGLGRGVRRFSFKPGSNGGRTGWNQVAWNGRNSLGELCGNGVYIFRISAQRQGHKSVVKKKFSILNR
ncbi:MAG: right-handed parallel beta-helix repeat-containing protein, partial [bacterium]